MRGKICRGTFSLLGGAAPCLSSFLVLSPFFVQDFFGRLELSLAVIEGVTMLSFAPGELCSDCGEGKCVASAFEVSGW